MITRSRPGALRLSGLLISLYRLLFRPLGHLFPDAVTSESSFIALVDNEIELYRGLDHSARAGDTSPAVDSSNGRDAVASYKEASRRGEPRSRESFFRSPFRSAQPWGQTSQVSLAEGTSYLRIVFASADYCLTCSVALVLPWRVCPAASRVPSRVFCLPPRRVHTHTRTCATHTHTHPA